jgi:hypothetical protein
LVSGPSGSDDAAALIREPTRAMNFVELDAAESSGPQSSATKSRLARKGQPSSLRGSAVVSTAAVGVPPTETAARDAQQSDRDGRAPIKSLMIWASAALDLAQQRGVRGGRVHEWLHARAARKAGVAELLTDNLSDFAGLNEGFSVAAP